FLSMPVRSSSFRRKCTHPVLCLASIHTARCPALLEITSMSGATSLPSSGRKRRGPLPVSYSTWENGRTECPLLRRYFPITLSAISPKAYDSSNRERGIYATSFTSSSNIVRSISLPHATHPLVMRLANISSLGPGLTFSIIRLTTSGLALCRVLAPRTMFGCEWSENHKPPLVPSRRYSVCNRQ